MSVCAERRAGVPLGGLLCSISPSCLPHISILLFLRCPAIQPERLRCKNMLNNIFIEITNHCNFNCTFCPNSIMKRPRGYMESALFYRLIDEVAENRLAEYISFHLMGEPLLHPKGCDFIAYCKEKGLKTYLVSNVGLLDDANIERILQNADYLEVSLQSFDDESFASRNAKRFTYEGYIGLIKKIIEARFFGLSDTSIIVTLIESSRNKIRNFRTGDRFVDSNETLSDLFDRHWNEFFTAISSNYNVPFDRPDKLNFKRFEHEFLPGVTFKTRCVTTWGNVMCRTDDYIPAYRAKCNGLITQLGVLWNGDVVPCCLDYDGNITLGNVSRSSLADVMESDNYVAMRDGFRVGRLRHAHCKRCKGGTNLLSWFATQAYSFIKYRNI